MYKTVENYKGRLGVTLKIECEFKLTAACSQSS